MQFHHAQDLASVLFLLIFILIKLKRSFPGLFIWELNTCNSRFKKRLFKLILDMMKLENEALMLMILHLQFLSFNYLFLPYFIQTNYPDLPVQQAYNSENLLNSRNYLTITQLPYFSWKAALKIIIKSFHSLPLHFFSLTSRAIPWWWDDILHNNFHFLKSIPFLPFHFSSLTVSCRLTWVCSIEKNRESSFFFMAFCFIVLINSIFA